MERQVRILALLLAVMLASGALAPLPVAADMITFFDSEDPSAIPESLSHSHEFDLQLFDTSLGTLTRVIVALESGASFETRHFSSPPGQTISEAMILQMASYELTLPTGVIMVTGTGTAIRPELNPMTNEVSAPVDISMYYEEEFTAAGALAAFSAPGGGLLSLPGVRYVSPNIDDGASGTTDAFEANENPRNKFGESFLSITYEYSTTVTAVPEPSSCALLGVGLFGMALRTCRRWRRRAAGCTVE